MSGYSRDGDDKRVRHSARNPTSATCVDTYDLRDKRDLEMDWLDLSWGADPHPESLFSNDSISRILVEYEQHVREMPTDTEMGLLYGNAFLQLGKGFEKRAIVAFTRLVELEPQSAESYYHLGLSLAAGGRLRRAVEAYQVALQLRPGNRDVLAAIFHAHLLMGSPADALLCVQGLLATPPGPSDT